MFWILGRVGLVVDIAVYLIFFIEIGILVVLIFGLVDLERLNLRVVAS